MAEFIGREIVDVWQDHGFGLTEPLRKSWRLRRHRDSPRPTDTLVVLDFCMREVSITCPTC
ncbi:MAG: hypothetical protein JSU97_06495 [Dehalococcoidia bacterium]|nr:MAG: hypothetical protein JSU97_06495 [Dehalococcoidia bacterium]